MSCDSRPQLRRAGSGESTSSSGSGGSFDSQTSRSLLFGEIPSSPSLSGSGGSLWSNSSVCNLVLSSSPTFLRFWHSDVCRDALLANVDQRSLLDFRLVCHDFATKSAPVLFKDLTINFKTSSFTKLGRMAALEHIGHHVRTLTFRMPHSEETFLPPLLDPLTGEERTFVYTPEIHARPKTPDRNARQPKYGSWEITELLIHQYPPLFHAATNVNSFMRAFSAMPFLSHLKICCPGQESSRRYRKSSVDYALISLRIAIERTALFALDSLSLDSVHPATLHALQPTLGPGSTPKSNRRWMQIKNLSIEMSSTPFTNPSESEHLRLLYSYLRFFSPYLTHLSFRYVGSTKGPSPLSIDPELLESPHGHPASPRLPSPPHHVASSQPPRPRRSLAFPRLRHLLLQNASVDTAAIRDFITQHRHHLHEFVFEDLHLRNGNWDDALASLRSEEHRASRRRRLDVEMSMDVPCMLSPIDAVGVAGLGVGVTQQRKRVVQDGLRIMETLEPQARFEGVPVSKGFSRWLEKRRERRKWWGWL